MARRLGRELLDGLPAQDPAAQRARRELRRVHRWMGTCSILARAFQGLALPAGGSAPLRVLELGAGDGTLLLGLAQRLRGRLPPVELTLLDRLDLVHPDTLSGYAACGWVARTEVRDAIDWSDRQHVAQPRWDLVVANLFLHHFEGEALARLLAAVAAGSHRLLACEPRRSALAVAGSHLLFLLGMDRVTRVDAVLSVQAGFRDRELSQLWPGAGADWVLQEYPAGLFSHCFLAARQGVGAP